MIDKTDSLMHNLVGSHFQGNVDHHSSGSAPIAIRLSHEIPKPKDWQAFQRNCVLLFRDELQDPHLQEFGRQGQDQSGIDLLGRRNGNPDHHVGVQCRRVARPLTYKQMLSDCREALKLERQLTEIIFATTAPDDTHATQAAFAVETQLRKEGHQLIVAIYGWESLQIMIARHEVAYAAFLPSTAATAQPISQSPGDKEFAAQVARQVVEQLRQEGISAPPSDAGVIDASAEDPVLHARIDTFRDLFKDEDEPLIARQGLSKILNSESLEGKPWAQFRIETNLGSIALHLGHQDEAALHYENAYSMRSADPNAVANLALARTIQGHHDEAMELSQQALRMTPRADHAVNYLLQAAARSGWQGDPESLIPADLQRSVHADLGLAEFLRWRDEPQWEDRCIAICNRHAGLSEFKRILATAVLSLVVRSSDSMIGGVSPVDEKQLNQAANDMKSAVERYLDIGYEYRHDLTAYVNNAALLLRICDRHLDCETLLKRAQGKTSYDAQLLRLLALSQANLGRLDEAIATLKDDQDPENLLIAAEMISHRNREEALSLLLDLDVGDDGRRNELRLQLIGQIALSLDDTKGIQDAIAGLRQVSPSNIQADLLEIQSDLRHEDSSEDARKRLLAIPSALPPSTPMSHRHQIAEVLRDQGYPNEALQVLEGHVDLRRPSHASRLYLQTQAAARHDEGFLKALESASPEVQADPSILLTQAVHAWNTGDLNRALHAVEALLAKEPNDPRARLLRIETYIRQDRSTELLDELNKPVEELPWTRLIDQFRIAKLLAKFGYTERAAAMAYKLFLKHQNNAEAWMTLSAIILDEGSGQHPRWEPEVVGPEVAVNVLYDSGESLTFVLEPNIELRRLDSESWELEHPLIVRIMGLAKGDRFTDANGREGTINALKHKYVSSLRFILANYNSRFPDYDGYHSISLKDDQTDGMDEIKEFLKARGDRFDQEQGEYLNTARSLGVLAHRLGLDTIEVAGGLASKRIPIKVSKGSLFERKAATLSILNNNRKGCALDLVTFWTAWRLGALEAIEATCGKIHLPLSVIDRLQYRREKAKAAMEHGGRSASYENGKVVVHEADRKHLNDLYLDIKKAIEWAQENAAITPLLVLDSLPASMKYLVGGRLSDIFDSLVIAYTKGILFISDDLPIRDVAHDANTPSSWLHQVLRTSCDQQLIGFDIYVRWTAHLVDAGHDFISISAPVLSRAAELDFSNGTTPGYFFTAMCRAIGGKKAELFSHIEVCVGCLAKLWSDHRTEPFREAATGFLLRQLVRERHEDYDIMLSLLYQQAIRLPVNRVRYLEQLIFYIYGWAIGHFIKPELIFSELIDS